MPVDLESGFEADRLAAGPGGLRIRWWFFAHVTGEQGRRQTSRLGVRDDGFRFARGGRTSSEMEAREALEAAAVEAQRELDYWRGQPSHALGPAGQLIPLGATEIER